jgi:hypothetical protein
MRSNSRKIDHLATFFRRLCAWERRPDFECVAPWKAKDVLDIKSAFKRATRLTHDSPPLAVAPSVTMTVNGKEEHDKHLAEDR